MISIIILTTILLSGCYGIRSNTVTNSAFPSDGTALISNKPKVPFVQEEYPDVWQGELLDEKGGVKCLIDVAVEYRPGPYMQYVVKKSVITKETAAGIARAFVPDTELESLVNTKSELRYKKIETDKGLIEVSWIEKYLGFWYGTDFALQEEKWLYNHAGTTVFFQNVKIGFDEAKSIGESFLIDAGLADYTLAYSDKGRTIDSNDEVMEEGWVFHFVRDFKEYVPYSIGVVQPGSLFSFPSLPGIPFNEDNIILFISEKGVRLVSMFYRFEIIESSYIEEPLLPFSEIQKIFIRLFDEGIEEAPRKRKEVITATRLILTMARTKDPSDPDRAIVRPIWLMFYSTEEYTKDRISPFVLAVDAITGERINPLW